MSGTDTTWAARDHARAQAGTLVETMPTVPARAWPEAPDGVAPEELTWAEILGHSGASAKRLKAGTSLRLRDRDGDACAHVLLFHAEMPWERLNVADTVKIPWQAYLGAGHPLLSDQGRVLATILADDSGHHDALCGGGPAVRTAMIKLGAKHGLEPRDLPPSLSFFEGVRVRSDGRITHAGSAGVDRTVHLRCELNVIVLLVNQVHPVDARPEHATSPLEVLAWRGAPTHDTDPLWSASPELQRAFENTADYRQAR